MTVSPLRLFDTHAHLDFESIAAALPDVLSRAREAGVVRIVTIGAGRGLAGTREALRIASEHEWIEATAGVHPHEATLLDDAALAELERLARAAKVVAIGETGLDYHYDHSPRPVQRTSFARQIDLARRLGKPIVVHTREAEDDTISILTEGRAAEVGGILHCFSGSARLAERALELGFHLSMSGIVTYKNAREVQDVARTAPRDRLLVETDAPYLAPVPRRGKPNEPAFVAHTLRFLAELRGEDPVELADATAANARRVYRLPD